MIENPEFADQELSLYLKLWFSIPYILKYHWLITLSCKDIEIRKLELSLWILTMREAQCHMHIAHCTVAIVSRRVEVIRQGVPRHIKIIIIKKISCKKYQVFWVLCEYFGVKAWRWFNMIWERKPVKQILVGQKWSFSFYKTAEALVLFFNFIHC